MSKENGFARAFGLGCGVLAAILISISPGLAGTAVSEDESITANVKAALAADPMLSKRDLIVSSFNRRVQLTGFVDSQKEATKAVELARDVEMVRSVQNNLMIAEGPGPHIIPRVSNWQSALP